MFKLIYETYYYRIYKEAISKILQTKKNQEGSVNTIQHLDNCAQQQYENLNHEVSQIRSNNADQRLSKYKARLCYKAKCYSTERSKRYLVDLGSVAIVKELQIYFAQTKDKPFNINIHVYGYQLDSEVTLLTKYIDEHMYSYLTSNSHLKEFGLYDPNEERNSIYLNLQGYTGRYISIFFNFIDSFATLNGSHKIAETILPEIIGDRIEAEQLDEIEEVFKEDILSTSQYNTKYSTFIIRHYSTFTQLC